MEEVMKYAESFYKPITLKRYARAYLKFLPEEVECLVCSGSSGVTIATAMILEAQEQGKELTICHVRKSGQSHRCAPGDDPYEWTYSGSLWGVEDKIAIVDDFVALGRTVNAILEGVRCITKDKNWRPKITLVWRSDIPLTDRICMEANVFTIEGKFYLEELPEVPERYAVEDETPAFEKANDWDILVNRALERADLYYGYSILNNSNVIADKKTAIYFNSYTKLKKVPAEDIPLIQKEIICFDYIFDINYEYYEEQFKEDDLPF